MKNTKRYDEARKRNVRHEIRTTAKEDKILKEKAQFCDMNLSRYLIEMGMRGYIVIQDLKTLSELANEIGKIGVNINQVAHRVNTDNVVTKRDMDILKASLNEIYDLVNQVIRQSEV